MPFAYANRCKETSTTTGTVTLNLAGAATGFRTFVAGIGTTNTCPYVIEDANGTAWEVGIGTVTSGSPDTLARTTLLDSSTGSAINLSAGTHTVYCDWPAGRARQAVLEHIVGGNADTTLAVGQVYVTDMSGWATADRTYTLPTTAAVGDRIGIAITAGNATYELIIKPASGDTINGGAAAAEWSRLFITGESVTLRCIVANTDWIVERDGRIPQVVLMRVSTSASAESSATWTPPTTKSGAWTADTNVGGGAGTSADKITVRRAGNYSVSAGGISGVSMADADGFGVGLWKNGTASGSGTLVVNQTVALGVASYGNTVFINPSVPLAVDDYLVYHYYVASAASKGLLGHAAPRLNSSFALREAL